MSSGADGGGAAAILPRPLPPERENLIQRNLRNKVCAYCKKPGATNKCEACEQRTYCDKKCQKKDWKAVHRGQCKKLQQVFVPPPAGWREAAAAAGGGGSGGGVGAAAGGGEGSGAVRDDGGGGEEENLCPICLDNEDNADVDGNRRGMCSACGQMNCGACEANVFETRKCPTCRATFDIYDEEKFKRLWKLVHDRSPGRHTPAAQRALGGMYSHGRGVQQDKVEAFKWYTLAAENGYALAQYNLSIMYRDGDGVKQDDTEAFKWCTLAAEGGFVPAMGLLGGMYLMGKGVDPDWSKGVNYIQRAAERCDANAIKMLPGLQQRNGIPTPPPGTHVTVTLLTSAAAAAKYNNKKGVVVALPEGEPAVKVGRAAVLLEGETKPISFKLMNLRIGE